MSKRISFKDLILKETGEYIFINKPALLSTLEDRSSDFNILRLARQYDENAQVCHRLDKETSGVLVIARNPDAYRHMSILLQERKVEKIYHAVVDGIQDFRDNVVSAPIKKNSAGGVSIDYRQGKDAETHFTTVDAYRFHSLVECRPLTGRMHQIRIHLAYLKAPIVSDHAYGGKDFYLSSVKKHFNMRQDEDEQPLIKRTALHALSIGFEDQEGKKLAVEAPYPKDFRVLVSQLEKNK